ncbi:hypothetical protein PP180_08505 [Muricauda sp. SK9]|uniref:hypothetical protein n=1 Tax=Flavobacteriaceae TaxID=49546 RepID=UPI0011C47D2C|nr:MULTISPECIES: hypothetical protein [Allomuricauda]MDC6385406.1 hypothetical protein [Muricauda sp. SK9]
MKKILLPLLVSTCLSIGCSNEDDGTKCESCTSQAGTTFRICENSNGDYKLVTGDESRTITKEEMEGTTPTAVVQEACAADRPL